MSEPLFAIVVQPTELLSPVTEIMQQRRVPANGGGNEFLDVEKRQAFLREKRGVVNFVAVESIRAQHGSTRRNRMATTA